MRLKHCKLSFKIFFTSITWRKVTKGAGGINGACGGINSRESGTVGNDGAAPLISGESAITTCAVVLNVREVFLLSLTP